MLRFAARYGFSVDRTLALTAAHLSAGRLLSPPSNLSYSRRSRWRAASAAVHLDAQVLPEPSSAPRPTLDLQQPDALAEGTPTGLAAVAAAPPPPPPPGGEPPRLRDPRTPPVQEQDMEPLAPEFVGDQSRTLQLRREMVLEAHPSVISTCTVPLLCLQMWSAQPQLPLCRRRPRHLPVVTLCSQHPSCPGAARLWCWMRTCVLVVGMCGWRQRMLLMHEAASTRSEPPTATPNARRVSSSIEPAGATAGANAHTHTPWPMLCTHAHAPRAA